MVSTAPCLLELKGLSKSFPGVQALSDVGIELKESEIVAIVGENGAGKSTLLKILGGVHAPDAGEIKIDGEAQTFQRVRDSMDLGISLIHQELNLAENLSIAENIFLGKQPSRGLGGLFTNRRVMIERSAELLAKVGLEESPRTLVKNLSVGQQQLVEIAKALSTSARILIFDEPTSSLSLKEATRLLRLILQLREQGTAILYVTHRLSEVTQLADRVIVLRDGVHVDTLSGEEINEDRMISRMVGRDIQQFFGKQDHSIGHGEPALKVQDLDFAAATEPISFSVRPGEIVGFAGLVGAGRTELARVLFGIDRARGGTLEVDGKQLRSIDPWKAIRAGLALAPEDRKSHGLVLPMSLGRNLSLAAAQRLSYWGWRNGKGERDLAEKQANELSIRSTGLASPVNQLSGGNQQKVVLGKWLAMRPRVLILDEPTRGVDVGAKSEIYRLIFELASRGHGIMLISSEMEEIIGVSDRVVVMHEGRISGTLVGDEITEEAIMALAIRSTSQSASE